jgi:uncharacterized membrane protein
MVRAVSSLRSSMSTAMIFAAPASLAPTTAASPTPADLAGVDGRADAGHDAAAEQAGDGGRDGRVDLGALAGRDEGLLGERADA